MEIVAALGAGVVAALALAVPLGAIGIMLIQEGAARGLRRGVAAAAGVATVDLLYCLAAVSIGASVAPVIASWGRWPRELSGVVLVAIAVRGLAASARAPDALPGAPRPVPSSRRFATFVALTAMNPATLLYFAAVVTGLSRDVVAPARATLFVAGVGGASFAWQCVLVAVGAGLRRRVGPCFARVATLVGNAIIGLLGIALMV